MTDLAFYDVVIESSLVRGPDGERYTAICKTCSTQHESSPDDFQMTDLYKLVSTEDGIETKPANALEHKDNYKEVLAYVAEMRAWNCHHEGEEPLDGFPEQPEGGRINYGEI
jgi:hypothetical protein